MLGISQKKGDPIHLTGRMVAYGHVTSPSSSELLQGMVQGGILAVSGNFVEQMSFQDFLRKEFQGEEGEGGTSGPGGPDGPGSEGGLAGLIRRLKENGGLPESVDGEELRRKLEGFASMEIIPVPAKLAFFDSEEEILREDADIYYLGRFSAQNHAHLAITSFPILYQSIYREQQAQIFELELGSMLQDIERGALLFPNPDADPVVLHLDGDLSSYQGSLLDLLLGTILPNLIYNLGSHLEFEQSMRNFRRFMRPYRHPRDLEELERTLSHLQAMGGVQPLPVQERTRLELMCQKMAALHHEQFERIPAIQRDLAALGAPDKPT